jgi:hypothetical protein
MSLVELIEQEYCLVITPTEELKNLGVDDRYWYEALPHDNAFYELIEYYLCNGWSIDETCLFSGLVLISPMGETYYDDNYVFESVVDKLLNCEYYKFLKYV